MDEIHNNSRVVMKLKLPISISKLAAVSDLAEEIYGKGLVFLTDHPDTKDSWLVLALPLTS